jgi:hypothetical protein
LQRNCRNKIKHLNRKSKYNTNKIKKEEEEKVAPEKYKKVSKTQLFRFLKENERSLDIDSYPEIQSFIESEHMKLLEIKDSVR